MRRLMICALLALPAAALAQDTPSPSAGDTRSRVRAGAVFTTQTEWASNALFAQPGGADDASGRVAVAAALALEAPRTTVRLTGGSGIMRYRHMSGMNSTLYGIGANVDRHASPRLDVRATGEVRTTLARELLASDPSSAVSPLSITRIRSASGGLRYALDPRTTGIIGAEQSGMAFDDPSLADGSRQRVEASIERAMSSQVTAAMRLEWNREVLRRDARQLYELSTALASRVNTVVIRGRIGSDLMLTPSSATRVLPAGELSVAREGRVTTASLGYTRRVVQGYDVGRLQTSNELSARAALRIGRRMEVSAAASGAQTTDLDAGGNERRLYGAEAELRQDLGGALSLVAGGYARRRTCPQTVDTHGFRLSIESRLGAN